MMRNVALTILGSVVFSGLATIASAGQELSPAKAAIAKGGVRVEPPPTTNLVEISRVPYQLMADLTCEVGMNYCLYDFPPVANFRRLDVSRVSCQARVDPPVQPYDAYAYVFDPAAAAIRGIDQIPLSWRRNGPGGISVSDFVSDVKLNAIRKNNIGVTIEFTGALTASNHVACTILGEMVTLQ